MKIESNMDFSRGRIGGEHGWYEDGGDRDPSDEIRLPPTRGESGRIQWTEESITGMSSITFPIDMFLLFHWVRSILLRLVDYVDP